MTCHEALRRSSRAAGATRGDAELRQHLRTCRVCSSTFEEQATISYVLRTDSGVRVPSDFATRVLARIEHPACLLERMDWKPWTLRLAPVAAGLLLFARLSVQQTPAFSLETLMDHWMDVRGQVPATGLFWRGALGRDPLRSRYSTAIRRPRWATTSHAPMTNRPRLWFVLFSTVVFTSGVATGLLLSGPIEPPAFARLGGPPPFFGAWRRNRAPTAIVDRMVEDLQLSGDQRQLLLRLFEERRSRLVEFQQDVRARFDQEHESLRASIQRILTPAQFERFESELRKRRPPPLPPE